jgi:hypothetical protein
MQLLLKRNFTGGGDCCLDTFLQAKTLDNREYTFLQAKTLDNREYTFLQAKTLDNQNNIAPRVIANLKEISFLYRYIAIV